MIDVFKYKVFFIKCIFFERKKKFRKRVDDGRVIWEVGSILSDFYYILFIN